MKSLKFNSNASVQTVCDRLSEHLAGIPVAVLTQEGDRALPDATVESVRTEKPKAGDFKVPSFKTDLTPA